MFKVIFVDLDKNEKIVRLIGFKNATVAEAQADVIQGPSDNALYPNMKIAGTHTITIAGAEDMSHDEIDALIIELESQ